MWQKIILVGVVLLGLQIQVTGQDYEEDDEDIRKGLTLGFGAGFGYSAHADKYEEQEFGLQKFSGLRGIVIDTKVGYRITNRFEIYGTAQYSPANTTISPYRSIYYGGTLGYYLKNHPQLSFHAGYGKYSTELKNIGPSGSGNLVNATVSLQVSDNFYFDLKILTGKMNKSDLQPNPFGTAEFNISFSAACKY